MGFSHETVRKIVGLCSDQPWTTWRPKTEVLRPVIESKGGWVPLVDIKTDANVTVPPLHWEFFLHPTEGLVIPWYFKWRFIACKISNEYPVFMASGKAAVTEQLVIIETLGAQMLNVHENLEGRLNRTSIQGWKIYHPGNHITYNIYLKGAFQDDVPFPKVGYVSSLGGYCSILYVRQTCLSTIDLFKKSSLFLNLSNPLSKAYFGNILQKPMWDDDDFQTYFEGHFEMWEFLGFDKWLTSLAASPENLVGFLQSPLLLGEKLTYFGI